MKAKLVYKGGPGSGNFGHAGIPGQVGGSSSDGGANETLANGTVLIKSGTHKLQAGEIQYKVVQDGISFFKLRKNGTPQEMRIGIRSTGSLSLEYDKAVWSRKLVDQLQEFAKTKLQGG